MRSRRQPNGLRIQRALLTMLVALTALLAGAQTSSAAVTPISDGELHWGVRESFRQYISFGGGTITASGGAQLCNGGICGAANGSAMGDYVRFEVTGGDFDDATNTLRLQSSGSVRFVWAGHFLDLKISDLSVKLSDGFSAIRADLESVENCIGPGGSLESAPGTCPVNYWDGDVLTELDLAGKSPSVSGDPEPVSTWSGVPSTLAPAGVAAFGGMYELHEAFDPVTFSYVGPSGIPRAGAVPSDLSITTQPGPQSFDVDSRTTVRNAVFSVSKGGAEQFTVKWQKRKFGEDWSDVPGAVTESIALPVTAADNGTRYRALYTTASGKLASNAAPLTVTVVDTVAPVISITSPVSGSTTTAASVPVTYSVSDNEDPAPNCTLANGASVPLTRLGANTVTVICVDAANNIGSAFAQVTRLAPPAPVPAPAAPQLKRLKKSIKVKQRGSTKISLARVTCRSASTCVYAVPKSVKVTVARKTYKLKLSSVKQLEPGASATIQATLPPKLVKAIRHRQAKLKLTVQVANAEGVRYPKPTSISVTLRG